MIWTKEKPTKPGWYWVRGACGNDVIFDIRPMLGGQLIYFGDEDNSWTVGENDDGLEYAGPIEKPQDRTIA